MVQAHIFYSGTVQGVGFRFTTQRLAMHLGLTGWVKNLPDGRVEIFVHGQRENIEQLCQDLDNQFEGNISNKSIEFINAQGAVGSFRVIH